MADEMQPRKVTIDLDEIWALAGAGILRGTAFAGLGTNAARNPKLSDFDLPGLLKLDYSRSSPEVQEVKAEFGSWVLVNALRDAVESFALALDRSYEALLLCEWTRTGNRPAKTSFSKFRRAGVEAKLKTLHSEFGIETAAARYLRSLNKVRNCLAHRMGIVQAEDCTEEGVLAVPYRRIEFAAVEENGREQIIPVDNGGSFLTESSWRPVVRFKEEERRFSLGTRVLFEPLDVKYIFWTLNHCGIELKQRIIAKLQEMGVCIKSREPGGAKPPLRP